MPDFSGPIQALVLAHWLWVIPLCPVIGALANAFVATGLLRSFVQTLLFGFAEDGSPLPPLVPVPRSARTSGSIAVASLSTCFALSLAYTFDLLSADPGRRALVQHAWQLLRVGQLDVGVDLTLDPLSATFLLVVTGGATIWALYARSGHTGTGTEEDGLEERARFFALFCLLVSGLTIAILAEDLGLLLFAWGWVGLASAFLLRAVRSEGGDGDTEKKAVLRTLATHRAGDAAALAGAALLLWSFGGGWTDTSYVSDLEARVQAVSLDNGDGTLQKTAGSTLGKGFLTVAALPGSLVYPDDSRTPLLDDTGLPLRTPFIRHEMAGGAHSFRVAPDDTFRTTRGTAKARYVVEGGVLTNYSVPRIAMGEGREVSLSVVGPTLRFREMRDQLVAKDSHGTTHLSDLLAHRALFGPRVPWALGLASCLLLLGASAKSAQLPLQVWLLVRGQVDHAARAVVQCSSLAIGVYLVARLCFVFSLCPSVLTLMALMGGATALYAAFASAFQYDLDRVLALLSIYELGLGFVALGSADYALAVLLVVTHAVTITCLLLARPVPGKGTPRGTPTHDLRVPSPHGDSAAMRAYRIAAISLTAVPLPGFAGSWPLAGVFAAPLATHAGAPWLAVSIYVVVVLAAAWVSFGVWRSYWLVFGGGAREPRKKLASTKVHERLLSVVLLLTLTVGAIVGLSPRWFGGEARGLLEEWLSPVFSPAGKPPHASIELRAGLVAMGLAAALVGWALARQRYGERRSKKWEAEESALPGAAIGARLR